jgi:phosphate-selective porin OprO/OprP
LIATEIINGENQAMKKSSSTLFAAKRIAVAVAAVCATLSMPALAADDMKNLMDLLLKKGVITQQEYDQNIKAAEDANENRAFKEKRLDSDVAKSNKFIEKNAKNGSVKPNGLGFESADGQHSINLTGRVHFDMRMNQNDFGTFADRDTASLADNFEIRRARIGFNGVVFKDIAYEVVANAVGSSTNIIDTAFITYGFNKAAQVRVGRFKQPFSLEELTSSNNIDFMERSYINQLAPSKKIGLMVFGEPVADMTYAVAAYQNDFNEVTNQKSNGREGGARLTYNFANMFGQTDSVIHLGLAGTSGRYQTAATSSSNTASAASTTTRATFIGFRSENRGLANIYRAQIGGPLLTTADYGGTADEPITVDKQLGGTEFVYSTGPYKLQAEYAQAQFDASSSVSSGAGTVKAAYAELMYNITGEKWSESYKAGVFGGIKPMSNFSASGSGTGALQLGLRFSQFDASDVTTTGTNDRIQNSAKANTTTLGLNWLLNPNARIMLNYSLTKFDTAVTPLDVDGATAGKDEHIISLRSQLNF